MQFLLVRIAIVELYNYIFTSKNAITQLYNCILTSKNYS